MNQRSDFWEYLQQVPVVDTHEHFHRFTDSQGYDDLVSFLYFNSYACIPAVYFPQKTVDIITDKTCDEKERFDAFCRFYEKIRYTQTGRTIRNIVRLWGIDDVTTENYVKLQTGYAKEFLREALRNIPTERVLAYGGDCHCAGEMTQITLIGALRTVDSVLTNAMEEGYLSLGEAEEVARIWLGESAKTLYGI